jgi:hypothetical protein
MEPLEKSSKVLRIITWLFILIGFFEVFMFIFDFGTFFASIPGLITIVSAYISLEKEKIHWKYYVGIWALIKYNPLVLAMTSFILQDFYNVSPDFKDKILQIVSVMCLVLVAIISSVFGIILIVKTAKHIKMQKLQLTKE